MNNFKFSLLHILFAFARVFPKLFSRKIIERLSTTGKPIYLMGDFNINLLRFATLLKIFFFVWRALI
jgi:hypothetical protein